MAIEDNLAIQAEDAILLARLHRTNALELIEQAQVQSDARALILADEALEHADHALRSYREALGALPNLSAAIQAKLAGDIALLRSGSASFVAREKLTKAAS